MWFVSGQGEPYPIREAARPSLEQDFGRHPVALLRHRRDPDFKASALGPASVGEATVENVRVRSGSVDVTLGIGASGRIHSATFHDRNAEGEVGIRTIVYTDFRAVEGMQLPYAVRSTFNGVPEPQQSVTLDAIALNAATDPGIVRAQLAGEAMNLLAAWAVALLAAVLPGSDPGSWPQWGGPSRNFVVESRALAVSWPAEGPKRLWQRPLGRRLLGDRDRRPDTLHALPRWHRRCRHRAERGDRRHRLANTL